MVTGQGADALLSWRASSTHPKSFWFVNGVHDALHLKIRNLKINNQISDTPSVGDLKINIMARPKRENGKGKETA